jgi:predicted DNA-binding protein
MNLSQIDTRVRRLTAVFAVNILDSTTLTSMINASLTEIYRKHGSGWPFPRTPLVNFSDVPPFDEQFHDAIVFRTAARVLKFLADDTNRGDYYLEEYQLLLSDMEKFYLSANAMPALSSGGAGLAQLSRVVRDLTGVYDKQTLSDGMLEEIINVAHTEFKSIRDWNHYSFYSMVPLSTIPWTENAPGTSSPAHSYPLQSGVLLPDLSQDLKRVKSVHLITGGLNGRVEQMILVDSLNNVDEGTDRVYYTLSKTELNTAVLNFAPKQQDQNSWVRINVYYPDGRITEVYDNISEETTFTYFEVPPQFQMLLPYRAAQFVLAQLAPDDSRIENYNGMYNTLLDAFITYDQLSHDTRTFSIGERGKDDPKYTPWFKPA